MISNMNLLSWAALLATLVSPTIAQTWTLCNPMERACPDNIALGRTDYKVDFTKDLNSKVWNHTNGVTSATSDGTKFTIAKRLQSPTIQSVFYIFFGSVEVVMKSAAGKGIVSSIVIQSENLDEIDWEWIGGNNTIAQSNYFGKGNQTSFDRAVYHPVETPNDVFHTYTINWTQEQIQWIIDGNVVRTLPYAAANGGLNFPQTPSTVRMGIWAGGDPSNSKGTIEWSQGETDYSQLPFNMIVKSATITDHGTGSAYHWNDKTGSFSSISSIPGTSQVAVAIDDFSKSTAVDTSSTASDAGSTTGSTTSGANHDSCSTASSTIHNPSSGSPETSVSGASNPVTSNGQVASTTLTTQAAIEKFQSLSTGAKVGVAGGSVAGVAAIVGLLAFCCARKRSRGRKARAEEAQRLALQDEENMRYAGMSSKEQDALPMGAMTPAQYVTDTPMSKQDTTYYGVHEIEGVDHDDQHGGYGVPPPPVYNGNGGQTNMAGHGGGFYGGYDNDARDEYGFVLPADTPPYYSGGVQPQHRY